MPDRPFFVYVAPGATHPPHHVPTEWTDRYAGEFDDGWDVQRERTFARQEELGVIRATRARPRGTMVFSADETTDIGYESGTTVTSDHATRDSRSSGRIRWVRIDLGGDDHEHLVDPRDRVPIAMAKQ